MRRVATLPTNAETVSSTLFRIRSQRGRGVDLLQRLPRFPAERLAELAGGDSRDVTAVSGHHRLALRVHRPVVDLCVRMGESGWKKVVTRQMSRLLVVAPRSSKKVSAYPISIDRQSIVAYRVASLLPPYSRG